ncbi:proline-rich protein 36-like [Eubalaena glacialis]|uniref:proline-rich protein 36-like n=1 Tax=Eubalaena glacialis TaxID=27606 RepID=UPI002A5A5FFE|nr:proline-rich protein 36-like [Eubalaena glacialis]
MVVSAVTVDTQNSIPTPGFWSMSGQWVIRPLRTTVLSLPGQLNESGAVSWDPSSIHPKFRAWMCPGQESWEWAELRQRLQGFVWPPRHMATSLAPAPYTLAPAPRPQPPTPPPSRPRPAPVPPPSSSSLRPRPQPPSPSILTRQKEQQDGGAQPEAGGAEPGAESEGSPGLQGGQAYSLGSLQGRAWGAGAVAGGPGELALSLGFHCLPQRVSGWGHTHSPESGALAALISVGRPLLSLGLEQTAFHPSIRPPVLSLYSAADSVEELGNLDFQQLHPPAHSQAVSLASCPLPLPCPSLRRLTWPQVRTTPVSPPAAWSWVPGRAHGVGAALGQHLSASKAAAARSPALGLPESTSRPLRGVEPHMAWARGLSDHVVRAQSSPAMPGPAVPQPLLKASAPAVPRAWDHTPLTSSPCVMAVPPPPAFLSPGLTFAWGGGVSAATPTWSHGCPELTASGACLALTPASPIPAFDFHVTKPHVTAQDVGAQLQVAAPPTPGCSEPGVGGGVGGLGIFRPSELLGKSPSRPLCPPPPRPADTEPPERSCPSGCRPSRRDAESWGPQTE